MTDTSSPALNASRERPARTSSGYFMLVVLLIVLFGGGFLALASRTGGTILIVALCVVLVILIAKGFYMLQPNQAAVITLFGSYRGTDRATGLRWVWPWLGTEQVSVRANNVISEQIKVNDLRGNPIEMAAQVVWRVTDTAQALFDVHDHKAFVAMVEGAVGMVEMALDMLASKKLVELDVERRAALVSNLMVVLCSERDTQPIVNTGAGVR